MTTMTTLSECDAASMKSGIAIQRMRSNLLTYLTTNARIEKLSIGVFIMNRNINYLSIIWTPLQQHQTNKQTTKGGVFRQNSHRYRPYSLYKLIAHYKPRDILRRIDPLSF